MRVFFVLRCDKYNQNRRGFYVGYLLKSNNKGNKNPSSPQPFPFLPRRMFQLKKEGDNGFNPSKTKGRDSQFDAHLELGVSYFGIVGKIILCENDMI